MTPETTLQNVTIDDGRQSNDGGDGDVGDRRDLYRDVLGSPKFVVAPMVDASELAWRMLSRKYKAELCYTPMIHSGVFVRDAKYRRDSMQTCPEDRPLIVQFCANDPEIFLQAVKYTVEMIDCQAVDLNLGCPQIIAKRGHFGSFLQDEWELLERIISLATRETSMPITVKCRVFPEIEKTVAYAQMLERAGARLITVHGRTREQKGPLTGLASWEHIRAVRNAVRVPVFANGNIQYLSDVERCLAETGVHGVMTAEGNLTNPALFAGINPPVWQIGREYLDLVDIYPCPISFVRGHMFKLLNHCLQIKQNYDLRDILAKSGSMSDFRHVLDMLEARYSAFHSGVKEYIEAEELAAYRLAHPAYICQPYVRPPPEQWLEKLKKIQEEAASQRLEESELKAKRGKTTEGDEESDAISRNKQKRKKRNPHKAFSKARQNCKLCVTCSMPAGLTCPHSMCKKCCKDKAIKENLDCVNHKLFIKTKRERRRLREEEENRTQLQERSYDKIEAT